MLRRSLLIAVLAGSSCASAPPRDPKPVETRSAEGHASTEKARRPNAPPDDSTLEVLGTGLVIRHSTSGHPPWESANIENVFGFELEPPIGSQVTLMPMEVDLAPTRVSVTSTKKRTDTGPPWWEVECTPIEDASYRDRPAPGDLAEQYLGSAAVLFPAPTHARRAWSAVSIPGVAPQVIRLAIDSTGDGQADSVVVESCCHDETQPWDREDCDAFCTQIFLRRGGSWKRTWNAGPL